MGNKLSSIIPLASDNKPKHIAIIMDGNNRWAKQRGQLGVSGHKAGVDAVRDVVKVSAEQGIEALTLFAFSSENWRRPEEEVSALMKLFLFALQREVKKLHKNNIQLRIIGDRSAFSQVLQDHMRQAEQLTGENTGLKLVIAANYGGQWDLVQSTKAICEKVQSGEVSIDQIDEKIIQSHINLADLPVPDLMIRTAGEKRISNFMLWQLAYAELYFSDLYWPDFKAEQMLEAIAAYGLRKRRFGQTDDQLDATV